MDRPRRLLSALHQRFSLERGVLAGSGLFVAGVAVDVVVLARWVAAAFGPLDEVRSALLASTLIVLGAQTVFGSFFFHLLLAGPCGARVVQPRQAP
jgi:hypothetical protein